VLRTKERTSIPYPSIVFTFGLKVESIKEFGGAPSKPWEGGEEMEINFHGAIIDVGMELRKN
jgi:hypothetical protein